MQGHIDESEYLKKFEIEKEDANLEDETEHKEQLLKILKTRLFSLFFRLNTQKFSVSVHYYIVMIAIEAFHLMTLVMLDGSYSKNGPYDTDSPWNLSQTQWLIDLCWVFRIDRYFRTSMTGLVVLMCIWGTIIGATIALGAGLFWYQQTTSYSKFAVKATKVLLTLITNLLFIPMIDTWAFAMKCSISGGTQCLSLQTGYQYMTIYVAVAAVDMGLVLLSSGLYFECCMLCGGTMAKPHSRFKLLNKIGVAVVIYSYYFVTSSGQVVIYLSISLAVGLILCYLYAQYVPYYNLRICKLKMAYLVAFTSGIFCMFIGEFFKSTDQTNSSVTMLFYFLTPCLIQITQLAMTKRGKIVAEKKMQQITNIYQVEIKARAFVNDLESARSRSAKSLYGESEENANDEFKEVQTKTMTALEELYSEALKKFPTSEYLYLWSGLVQLHIFNNYVLAMMQCFKGLLIANKLDTQYLLFQFRRSSESFYKANMKDDAYDYVMFERSFGTAQKNDEAVMRAQFFFWMELESKNPKIQKLTKLAGEGGSMIVKAKANYQNLLKLNSKNTSALRMFGGFLTSLNNFAETGQRYIQKADAQDEVKAKNVNANAMNALTQQLSFFDTENAIVSVSADFETIGEIEKANVQACSLLGYLQAELVGRNISLIVPPPYSDSHDSYMRRFHDTGAHFAVDVPNLIMYFVSKSGHLLECRALIKVVPNGTEIPFFMAVIKPTKPKYEIVQMTNEFMVTGATIGIGDFLELNMTKGAEQTAAEVVTGFEDIKEEMIKEDGCVLVPSENQVKIPAKCRIVKYHLGEVSTLLMKLERLRDEGRKQTVDAENLGPETDAQPKSINVVSTLSQDSLPNDQKEPHSSHGSKNSINHPKPKIDSEESASSEEENSEEVSEEESSSESSSDVESVTSPKDVNPVLPGAVGEEGHVPAAGNEKKPLLDRGAMDQSASEDTHSLQDEASPPHTIKDKSADFTESMKSDEEESEELSEEKPQVDAGDQHSVYSSSKSVNSSMASLAQFNKSIKALIIYEFDRTNKFALRFKYTLLLTILILIVTSIVTYEVIDSSASFNTKLSHYVNLVGNLRLYSQSLSYYVRIISLMDQGMVTLNASDRSNMFQWMAADTTDMHAINLELYKNYDVLSAADKNIYVLDDIPTWFIQGGQVTESKANLLDATTNLILQGFLTGKELENSTLTLSNRRAFYLFRNGHGESLSYLNQSAIYYVNAALRDIDNQRLTALMLIMLAVLLLLFCAAFAVVPAIRELERSKSEVWNIFFEIPAYVCRIMKGKCNDRLQILNEAANIEMEEGGGGEDAHEEEKGDGEAIKPAKIAKREEKASKRIERESRKTLAYDARQRNIVILKMSAFFLISFIYFYLIYYTGFQSIQSVFEDEPVNINWASRLRQLSRAVDAWVLEALMENVTSVGYKFVVPMGQSVGSPYAQAAMEIDELEYVENSLIFGNPTQGLTFSNMRSSEHDNLLFQDACIAPVVRSDAQCPTIGNKVMTQGLHSALGMYVTLARTLLLRIQNWQASGNLTKSNVQMLFHSDDMSLLRSMDNMYLYDPLTYSSSLYESDFQDKQNSMAVYKNLLITLYTVFSLIFFFVVYSPMINRIGKDVKNAWSMCTLIPQEYQEEFKMLNSAIKERRDNFKYR